MRILTAIAIAWLASMSAAAQTVERTVDPDVIAKIEQSIKLPKDADNLSEYARYYGGITREIRDANGKPATVELIAGMFIPADQKTSIKVQPITGLDGAYSLAVGERFPYFFDGGCSLISLVYDPKARKFLPSDLSTGQIEAGANARCNGLA